MCRLPVGGWRLPVYYSAVFPGRTRGRLPHRRAAALKGGLDPQGVPRGYGIAPPGRAVSAKADGPPRGTDCCADPAPSILRYTLTSCHSSCNTGNIRLYYVVHHQSVHGTHHDEP